MPLDSEPSLTPTAVQNLVSLLHQFERAQDQALALSGQLTAAVIAAQVEQRLAPGVTQSVFTAFSQAVVDLTAGRARTIEGHRALEAIARLFNIEAAADGANGYGDGIKYPPATGVLTGAARVAA